MVYLSLHYISFHFHFFKEGYPSAKAGFQEPISSQFHPLFITHSFVNSVFCLLLDQEPQTELVAQFSQEFYKHNVFQFLVKHLSKLDFEVGK